MPNPTTYMGLTKPTEGGSANVWDVLLDAIFDTIDPHDHTTGKGVQVPTAGININADLTFAGFGITHLKMATLDEQSSTPGNKSIWTSSVDHDLYWTNSSGVDVKITDGSTLNVSIVGGIGGDYSSVGALLSYDDATHRYLLQQEGSPRPWAGLATADIDLYEKAASIVNGIKLKSPSALAGSYTVTWFTALPASTKPVYITPSGQLTTTPSFVTTIHAAAARGDLDGFTAAKFQGVRWELLDGGLGSVVYYPIDLPIGMTITDWALYINKATANTTTVQANTKDTNSSTGATTDGAAQTNADNATGSAVLSQSGLSIVVASGHEYAVIFGQSVSTTAGDTSYHLEVTWKP